MYLFMQAPNWRHLSSATKTLLFQFYQKCALNENLKVNKKSVQKLSGLNTKANLHFRADQFSPRQCRSSWHFLQNAAQNFSFCFCLSYSFFNFFRLKMKINAIREYAVIITLFGAVTIFFPLLFLGRCLNGTSCVECDLLTYLFTCFFFWFLVAIFFVTISITIKRRLQICLLL